MPEHQYTIISDLSPEDQKRLYPGGLGSDEGFLLHGQELKKVIRRDKKALGLLGYTTDEITDELLGPLIDATNEAEEKRRHEFSYQAPNKIRYRVHFEISRGSPECPWCGNFWEDKKRFSGCVEIFISPKGQVDPKPVLISDMLGHLIGHHGFFEGGRYRVAPEDLVEMFGVERIHGSIQEARKLHFNISL